MEVCLTTHFPSKPVVRGHPTNKERTNVRRGLNKASPTRQAQVLVRDRGTIQSPFGYGVFPWNTHPNDTYRRVFPDGPFDRAWEGVQKINLISSVGMLRASIYDPNVPVFNFEDKSQLPRIERVHGFTFGGGPASIAAQEQEYQQTGQAPSFLRMVIGRLRGG